MAIADMTEFERKSLKKMDAIIALLSVQIGSELDAQRHNGILSQAKADEMSLYLEVVMKGGMEPEGTWQEDYEVK